MPKSIATSTPMHPKSTVLKEKLWSNVVKIENLGHESQIIKKVFDSRTSMKSQNLKPTAMKTDRKIDPMRENIRKEKKREQHRQQATEAMRIAEQRRLRLCSETEQLTTSLVNMKLNDSNNDEIENKWAIDTKRIEMKRLKHQRIMQHLAEQEKRTNTVNETDSRNKVEKEPIARKRKVLKSSTAHPSFRITRNRLSYKCPKKPNTSVSQTKELRKANQTDNTISEDREIAMLQKTAKHYVVPKIKRPDSPILRGAHKIPRIIYSKDDLRTLNPYGYYNM